MNRVKRLVLRLAPFLLLLAACAPRAEIRSSELTLEVEPVRFELVQGRTAIERFDPPGAGGRLEMRAGAQVVNPNPFGVWLDAVTYTVHLEGKAVTRGVLQPDAYLGPGASTPVLFDVDTTLVGERQLLRAAARAFAGEPLGFRVDGSVRFRTNTHAYETRNATLFSGGALARRSVRAPEVRVDEVASRAFMLQPGVPVIQVALTVVNPGEVGYFLAGKGLSVALSSYAVAAADMAPVPVPANRSTRIDMLFYPDPERLDDDARAALDWALGGYTTLLKVEGELYMDVLGVDSFRVPGEWRALGFIRSR